jgi:galactokinase
MKELVTKEFEKRYSTSPEYVVCAPGRVNLIGEHTDYNDGFVLPMAIDRAIWIALQPRQDNQVQLHSLNYPTPAELSLDDISHGEGWSDYIQGMTWALQALDYPLLGWEGVLASDIPVASGLSSSAALELATACAFWALTRWDWDGALMAKAAKKMENEWLNLKSGIMDQMVSACGEEKHALLIDCRDLMTRQVPIPGGVSIVVMDTAVRRGLVDSAYNERVEQCRIAAAHFGVKSLRDVTREMFSAQSSGLDDLTLRRARHIISENERVLRAVEALKENDLTTLGELMLASHASLRDDYEVSCLELDTMVELACKQEGCLGARMTGAGFGGCAIALVESTTVDTFIPQVHEEYKSAIQGDANVFAVEPSEGTHLVSTN